MVVAQDKIESQKGTLTFKFVDLYGKIVKTVTQRINEGIYDVPYEHLGLKKDNVKFVLGANVVGGVSGGLTVTIKSQQDKVVMIVIDVK